MLAQERSDEAWAFCPVAFESVPRKTRELELLVAKLRRERLGRHSERIGGSRSRDVP